MQLDDVDPVIEILTESPGLHQFLELPVRRGEDSHVHRHLARFANRPNGLLLDYAQQLHLHVQRQVGHLVQEQRAALGAADQPFLVGHGAREAALLVAEQLGLHQLRRDGAAIDGDERPVRPRAGLVDEPRRQLLAGARVAGDVHRRLRERATLPIICRSCCMGFESPSSLSVVPRPVSSADRSPSLSVAVISRRSAARSSGFEMKSNAPSLSARTAPRHCRAR